MNAGMLTTGRAYEIPVVELVKDETNTKKRKDLPSTEY